MLIIDFHTHCFPDSIAARAIDTLRGKAKIPNHHDGTFSDLDRTEREAGCGGFVIMSIATNPKQTASVNRFAASAQDEGRNIYAFGSVHHENTDYKEQLYAAKSMGLRGIKLHPDYQYFRVNDEKLFPIYDEIFRQGFPLMLHSGEDLGFTFPWNSEPDCIAEVAARYPQAVIIAAHMGGYRRWKQAIELLSPFPNVLIDVSFYADEMPAEDFQQVLAAWGAERMLFGSDTPWKSIRGCMEAVMRLKCSEEERELIFSGNAMRVLNLVSR